MTASSTQGSVQDQGGSVRVGEELNVSAVDAWMHSQVPGLQGQPEVTQFSGGASNWTYRLKYANGDYILRRPPKGTKAKGAHDMGREFKVQQALKFMGQPADARVTSDVGREICQREGIRAMITGSISSLGSQYLITLDAVNASTGDTLAETQAQAAGTPVKTGGDTL